MGGADQISALCRGFVTAASIALVFRGTELGAGSVGYCDSS